MDKKTQGQIINNLLITHELLESENTVAALEGRSEIFTAKSVIAQLVLKISNANTQEEGE